MLCGEVGFLEKFCLDLLSNQFQPKLLRKLWPGLVSGSKRLLLQFLKKDNVFKKLHINYDQRTLSVLNFGEYSFDYSGFHRYFSDREKFINNPAIIRLLRVRGEIKRRD